MSDLYESEVSSSADGMGLQVNTGLIIHAERGSALGRVTGEGAYKLVRGDREVFGLHGRSAEQRIAIDLLLDPDVGIVSLGGRAGTGKSAIALCAGLEAVLARQQQRKIIVFRPLFPVGCQELGYLSADSRGNRQPRVPAGARRRSRCAPASRPFSSASSSGRSSSSGRCSPSVARSSVTCPATRRRR